MPNIHDDRTAEEFLTHQVIVYATDRAMSGWGDAKGGASVCGWACTLTDWPEVERWVRARPGMLRVSVAFGSRPRRMIKAAHAHVYVVRPGHPAQGGLNLTPEEQQPFGVFSGS